MKWILWAFLLLGGGLMLITLIGWLLPKEHAATRQGRYHQPPETVWRVITDVDAMPSWREGLKSVKHLPDKDGLPAHLEITTTGEIPVETVEMSPPRKLVTRIADPQLPFGGRWTFEIIPTAEGSALRLTENGFVTNPVFRFLSRFVFGHTRTIETYLQSLSKKFGEPPRIEE
jgi:uncharacterized protein YndB with AHSA1/START domain